MAHFTALAAARHAVLRARGWDVEARRAGRRARRSRVVAGANRHVHASTARCGCSASAGARSRSVAADDQRRMEADALARALAGVDGPTIVCAQAGEVNTAPSTRSPRRSTVAAAPRRLGARRRRVRAVGRGQPRAAAPRPPGVERADSWATDAHKWLNVPYDCGVAFCAHPEAHRAAMGVTRRLPHPRRARGERDAIDWTPESSRRARGLPVYAALRSLGRAGVAELVDRCCALAARVRRRAAALDGVEVLNDVVLNQVLFRFADDDDDRPPRLARVQAGGDAWMGGTSWDGRPAIRMSVSNWRTTEADDRPHARGLRRGAARLAGEARGGQLRRELGAAEQRVGGQPPRRRARRDPPGPVAGGHPEPVDAGHLARSAACRRARPAAHRRGRAPPWPARARGRRARRRASAGRPRRLGPARARGRSSRARPSRRRRRG